MRLMIPVVLLALSLPAAAQSRRAGSQGLTVEEQYELGVRYMNRGYYTKAIEQFNRIRNYYRDDPHSVKAELAIADVYFKKSEYTQARLAYDDFMRMHPRHPELDYVTFRMGMTLYKESPKAAGRDQTWTRQAVNTWSGFEGRFPESEYHDDVQEKLVECRERLARKELVIAQFYANPQRKSWHSVLGRVDGLLRTYPNSDYVPEALELKAIAHAHQGETVMVETVMARLNELSPETARRAERRLRRIEPET